MTLSQIIHYGGRLDVSHMSFVVEQYIKQRKGTDITIMINIPEPSAAVLIFYADEVQLLMQAYEIAAYWFKEQAYGIWIPAALNIEGSS